MLQVLDRHLCLAVRPQPPEQAALADVRQFLAKASGHGVRQRHAILGLVASVAEHDALIAGADIHVILANVHTTCDVRALLVDAHQHLASLVTQALAVHAGQVVDVGVEADLGNNAPDDLVIVDLGLRRDLASDHDHVVLRHSLASDLALGILCQAGVQDGVRDLVAELVRVALVDRLRGEQEHAPGLGFLLCRLGHCGGRRKNEQKPTVDLEQ
mmetsp:Transcript_42691/g.108390  ORF Transcript_42691/g.108390 Transcript_42691/m.108390 type:complete len:214 (-) Transcript_42691:34-675(-)